MNLRSIFKAALVALGLVSLAPLAFGADEAAPAPGRDVASKHKHKKKHHKGKKHGHR